MKIFNSILLATAFLGANASVMAMDNMKSDEHMKMEMKMMDKNGDGMISKQEYMNYHEMMWGKMKKNKDGMADMKGMSMMDKDSDMMMNKGMHK